MTTSRFLKNVGLCTLGCVLTYPTTILAGQGNSIKPEMFEASVTMGSLSIEDFPSELMGGMSVSFIASEDFFVEYNYLTASISLSSFEKKDSSTIYTKEEGRNFRHYDLLLGYNLFQSEFFTDQRKSLLSNLYLVLGAGDTKFGTEDNFTYTWGVGYRTQVTEKFFLKVDFRNHLYESALITGSESDFYSVTQFSGAIGMSF